MVVAVEEPRRLGRARALLPSRDEARAALPTPAELADLAQEARARARALWEAGRRIRRG